MKFICILWNIGKPNPIVWRNRKSRTTLAVFHSRNILCFHLIIKPTVTKCCVADRDKLFLVVTCVNIFMSSGSAKWAIFAPIFVPMFMLLGYHPGFTQLLYRIGDSPFNCWTPMSAYIWMILSVAQTKYVPDLKIGTLISNMIPMSIVLQIAWIIVVVIWMMIGLPFGPGVGVALPAGIL